MTDQAGDDVGFDDADIAARLSRMTSGEIDRLPFGVVCMTLDGVVTLFSDRERELSGYQGEPLGRSWLRDIAPCMNNPIFQQAFRNAAEQGELEAMFEVTGDFRDADQTLEIRLTAWGDEAAIWMLLRRV